MRRELTLQAVDEPHQLLLGDVGATQAKRDRLPADHAAQHGGSHRALAAQVDPGPQSLVTAPGGGGGDRRRRLERWRNEGNRRKVAKVENDVRVWEGGGGGVASWRRSRAEWAAVLNSGEPSGPAESLFAGP